MFLSETQHRIVVAARGVQQEYLGVGRERITLNLKRGIMRNFLRSVIIFVLIVFPFSQAQARDLTQEQWIEFMTKNLPTVFCDPSQYYRECFEVTQEECKDMVTLFIGNCIDKNIMAMPETFDLKESRTWGSILEKCVDEIYVNTYTNLRIDNEYCSSIK